RDRRQTRPDCPHCGTSRPPPQSCARIRLSRARHRHQQNKRPDRSRRARCRYGGPPRRARGGPLAEKKRVKKTKTVRKRNEKGAILSFPAAVIVLPILWRFGCFEAVKLGYGRDGGVKRSSTNHAKVGHANSQTRERSNTRWSTPCAQSRCAQSRCAQSCGPWP